MRETCMDAKIRINQLFNMLTVSVLGPIVRLLSRNVFKVITVSTSTIFCQGKLHRNIVNVGCDSLTTLSTSNKNCKIDRGLEVNDAGISPRWRLISQLNFESVEDAKPFLKLPIKTLLHICKITKVDEQIGHCKNRLYYIADRIECSPSTLSPHLAKRIFIFTLSFEWLERSLNVLLEMGVSGDRILRDLWVLKYHPETIKERLQRVKDMGVDTLYPWMVRCSEEILKRSICISRETKDILGDTKTTKIYLADRLNTTLETVDEMCFKIPALNTIRVTKVKSFLDFLEKEGFDISDIANKPRVLTSSQTTVHKRLEMLRKLGMTDINLNVLCRSRKHFKKYLESVELAICNK